MSRRSAVDKTKYACAYCGQRFVKMTDHMTHVVQSHDTGQKSRGERLTRPISCWRCGTVDVYPSGDDDWFRCACGWELPRNWVNGQLVADELEAKDTRTNDQESNLQS